MQGAESGQQQPEDIEKEKGIMQSVLQQFMEQAPGNQVSRGSIPEWHLCLPVSFHKPPHRPAPTCTRHPSFSLYFNRGTLLL